MMRPYEPRFIWSASPTSFFTEFRVNATKLPMTPQADIPVASPTGFRPAVGLHVLVAAAITRG